MEHLSSGLATAIAFISNTVASLGRITMPGTDLPIIIIGGAVWGIYFIWRWVLSQVFDVEVKK